MIPLATITTILGYFLSHLPEDTSQWLGADHLIKSMLFLPLENDSPPAFGYRVIAPQWTLTYEIIFYLYFAMGLAFPQRRVLIAATVTTVTVIGLQCMSIGFITIDVYAPKFKCDNQFCGLLSLAANPLFFEFVAGLAIAKIYLSEISLPRSVSALLAMIGVLAFAWCFFVDGFSEGRLEIFFCVFFLILTLVMYEKTAENLRVSFVLLWLGNISYSIYLWHYLINTAITRFQGLGYIQSLDGHNRFLLMVFLTLSVSHLSYRLIERPFQAIGKRLASSAGAL